MTNIIHHLSGPVIYAFGWTLFHALWQGFALVLLTALALHAFRNQSSELRYRVSVWALFSQFFMSALTFGWYYKPVPNASYSAAAGTSIPSFVMHWQAGSQKLPWPQQIQLFLDGHLYQFVLIYVIGVLLFGLRLAGGWFYLQHLSRTATQPFSDHLTGLVNTLRSTVGIRSAVQIRESARIVVPMVTGVLKPVLLLPIGLMTHLSMAELEAVIAHELAHVKRYDYAVNLLQSVMEVLYFFHPALWWLSARVREEREHCCDDLAVVACGGNGRLVAQALARVEELRLVQSNSTPSLAMALTTKRQLLLHRVRRMLGVPTRPFVSNSSLAGLTLATILLMSVSVYAIQKQADPKFSTTQPKPSRKYKIDSKSEYGMADNNRISYIIWKGKKLSTARVASLQRKLDQVMAGQTSLDNIPQPDRDILLTIIEKNAELETGMAALSEGLSHIDYSNIVASALTDVPLSSDGTVEGLANVNYDSIIHEAMAAVKPLPDSLGRLQAIQQGRIDSLRRVVSGQKLHLSQQKMDSLSRLMAEQSKQLSALHLQMEKLRFPIEEFERSRETFEWQKQRLMDQRQKILDKRQELMQSYSNARAKIDPAAIEKQLEDLEPEIKKQEVGVEALNKRLEEAQSRLETARLPMEKLERQVEELTEQVEKISGQLENRIERIMIDRFPLKEGEKESVEYNADLNTIRIRGPLKVTVGESAPARPAKPAKPLTAPAPAKALYGQGRIAPATPALPPPPPDQVVPAAPATKAAPSVKPAPKVTPASGRIK